MDTTSGELVLDTGHVDGPDVTATLDYETAKAMMVDSNPQAAMQAFMAGKIKLQGDMTKAMALQSGPPNPELTKRSRRSPSSGSAPHTGTARASQGAPCVVRRPC